MNINWNKKYTYVQSNYKIIRILNYDDMETVEEDDMPIKMQMSSLELFEACRNLTPSGLKLYLYLMSKENYSEFPLSRQDVMETMGFSKKTYLNAVKELIDEDYLKYRDGYWYFLPRPGIENF